MESIRSSSKNSLLYIFEYFTVFIVIFYAGKASLFVGAIESWANPIGLMLPILTFGALAFMKGIHFNYKFILLISGYIIYTIASTIKFGAIHPRFFAIYLIKFIFAYIIIASLRIRFFRIYEDLIYYLCIIALVFWTIQNIIPVPFIEFLRNFEFSTQGPVKGNVDFNTIVYTIPNFKEVPKTIMHLGGIQVFRNAGFAWEPGGFATFINLAILINLIRNNMSINSNKHFFVFVFTLITTFSTTGYSIFIIIILFYIYNQHLIKMVWMAPIVLIATTLIFTLPFMREKITDDQGYTTKELVYYSAKYGNQYSTQRFQSLQIDFVDYLNHPIIGYGGHEEARWTNNLGAQIFTVSGIGKILARFGTIGFIFFLFSLWQSTKEILKLYKLKGTIFPVLIMFMISISYSLFTILFMCIWLFYLPGILKVENYRKHILSYVLKTIETQSS
ncbi:hypothetical protein SAMN05444285_12635 [Draconibacterium orientale]|uniref:O-Antigen ligase n=1 Tax=Draconibacterium orientale TaxID=1168034 RepID=X5DNR0_9BACT|nr:hypothetical protein [Draconibacterium orientale]AHW62272.1 hypothetical protein FH5T_18660 [Draconibacterium orientale]SET86674.1 hypothetical protein SAMN05444285_12635 [Draconibacterium orientale]